MNRSRVVLFSGFALAFALVFHQPFRLLVLSVIRFPLTVTKGVFSFVVQVPYMSRLNQDNEHLRQTVLLQHLELVKLKEEMRRFEHLNTLMEDTEALSGVPAQVIGRSPIPTQHTILIDKGSQDGVVAASVVVNVGGVLGRVIEVYPTTSLVLLLTDPDSRVSSIVERSREMGLLAGKSRSECELLYLDANADVQKGDRVLTAGLGGPFPKGLRLGTIVEVNRNASVNQANALVAPDANAGHLEEVMILWPNE